MIHWFSSKTYRRAREIRKQVRKLLAAQDDILGEQQKRNIQEARDQLVAAIANRAPREECAKAIENLEQVANQNFRPYPNPSLRENVEVLLVAVAVAMAVRTFFLQPFKIPTGSMQPTLYGITTENLNETGDEIPPFFERLKERWIKGVSYYHLVAKADGQLSIGKRHMIIPFLLSKQTVMIGGVKHTLWNPPKNLTNHHYPNIDPVLDRAGIRPGETFQKGDEVINLKLTRGDYLFVDRFTYNFRRPKRGEIIVFETKGIEGLPQNLFYIKRLVALGGDAVRIGDDRHLVINGKRLDASTPHFEKIYSFDPSKPPRDSKFSGHLNQKIAWRYGFRSELPYFPNEETVMNVRTNHYLAMGDNTMNSLDSRSWGSLPRTNVIGKYAFVYWPFTDRWAGGVR